MKALSLAAALALTATACAPMATLPPPAAIADRTVLDEQAALAVELAYQAAGSAFLIADHAGLVSPAMRPRIVAADTRAYAAVLAVRAAYDAGNATGYASAAINARAAVASLLTAIKGA